jgi:sugar lactone lactonase YvrE
MERHLCLWDWQAKPVPLIEVAPSHPDNRLNEGVVGPDDAIWVGTMLKNINDDDSPRDISAATGQIYRYDPDCTLIPVSDDRFGIVNTLAFPRPSLLLTANTLANTVYSYRVGPGSHLSHRKQVMSGFPRGLPDGTCLDAQERLWTAPVAAA